MLARAIRQRISHAGPAIYAQMHTHKNVFSINNKVPQVHNDERSTAWIAPTAAVIGDVILHHESSVWFGAVLRGDNAIINVGKRTNIQDGSVLHTDPGLPLTLGTNVTIGHLCMLHGCTIGDGTLIGMNTTILNGAVIGSGCIVGAGSLITQNKVFPDGSLIMGSPAKVVRALTDVEKASNMEVAGVYVSKSKIYSKSLVPCNPIDLSDRD